MLSIHQVIIDIPGGLNGGTDHFLGDLVEGNTLGLLIGQLQQLLQVPGNGLTLTVRVSCQIHGAHRSSILLQLLYKFLLATDRDILRFEILLQVYTHFAFGQIPEMAHAGFYNIIRPQILANGLGFGGGLHDYEIGWFGHE